MAWKDSKAAKVLGVMWKGIQYAGIDELVVNEAKTIGRYGARVGLRGAGVSLALGAGALSLAAGALTLGESVARRTDVPVTRMSEHQGMFWLGRNIDKYGQKALAWRNQRAIDEFNRITSGWNIPGPIVTYRRAVAAGHSFNLTLAADMLTNPYLLPAAAVGVGIANFQSTLNSVQVMPPYTNRARSVKGPEHPYSLGASGSLNFALHNMR